MRRHTATDAERLACIREWYGRHQHDYDPRAEVDGVSSPPKVWSEYFGWLLERVRVDEPEAVDAVARTDRRVTG